MQLAERAENNLYETDETLDEEATRHILQQRRQALQDIEDTLRDLKTEALARHHAQAGGLWAQVAAEAAGATRSSWPAVPVLSRRSRWAAQVNTMVEAPNYTKLAQALDTLQHSTRRLATVVDLTLSALHMLDQATVDMAQHCVDTHVQQCQQHLQATRQLLQQHAQAELGMPRGN